MNEKNLVKILAATAVILMIVFISVICIDTHESTSLTVKSPDTLKDGDSYSVELCDSKGNPIANQDISISFGSNSFNLTTDENGIAVLKIMFLPESMTLKFSIWETVTIKILQLFTMLSSQKSKKPAA